MTENYFEIDKDGNVTVSAFLQALFPDLTYELSDDMRSIKVNYGALKCTGGQTAFVRSTSDGLIRYNRHDLTSASPLPYIVFDIETRTLTMDTSGHGIYGYAANRAYVDQFITECSTIAPFVDRLILKVDYYYLFAPVGLELWLDGAGDLLLPNLRHFTYDCIAYSTLYNVAYTYDRNSNNSYFHPTESGVILYNSYPNSFVAPIPHKFWNLANELRGYSEGLGSYADPLINTTPKEGYEYEFNYFYNTYKVYADFVSKIGVFGGHNIATTIDRLVTLIQTWTANSTVLGVVITRIDELPFAPTKISTIHPEMSDVVEYNSQNFLQFNIISPFPALEIFTHPSATFDLQNGILTLASSNYNSTARNFGTLPFDAVSDLKLKSIVHHGQAYDSNGNMDSESIYVGVVGAAMCDLNAMAYLGEMKLTYLTTGNIVFYWNRNHQSIGAIDATHINFLFGTWAVNGSYCWINLTSVTIFEGGSYSGLNVNPNITELWCVPTTMTIPQEVLTAFPNLDTINGIPMNSNWFADAIEAGTIVWYPTRWNQAWIWHESYHNIVTRASGLVDDGVQVMEMPRTIADLNVTIDVGVADPVPYQNLHSVAKRFAQLDTQLPHEYLKVNLGMNIETECCKHGVTVYFWWNDTDSDFQDYAHGRISNFARETPPADLTNVKKLLMVSLNWETVEFLKNDAFVAKDLTLNQIYPVKVSYSISTGSGLTGPQPLRIQSAVTYQDGSAAGTDLSVCTAHGVKASKLYV